MKFTIFICILLEATTKKFGVCHFNVNFVDISSTNDSYIAYKTWWLAIYSLRNDSLAYLRLCAECSKATQATKVSKVRFNSTRKLTFVGFAWLWLCCAHALDFTVIIITSYLNVGTSMHYFFTFLKFWVV